MFEEIEIKLGDGHNIDKNVILGYPAPKPHLKIVEIGKNARIRSGTVIYSGCKIGDNLETGHNVVIREENEIGNYFSIWSNSVVDYGCKIGNNVKVHCNVYIAQFTIIEDEVFIAPCVAIANEKYAHPKPTKNMRGPVIKRGARIGINAVLLPNITVGEYSLIGAGSVVTKDVPAYAIVAGNPARIMKYTYEMENKY